MVFFTYVDRPGIIGTVGTMLGEHDVNIATMDVGRKAEGGDALMCLTVDTEVAPDVLAQVAPAIDAHQLRTVTLPASGSRGSSFRRRPSRATLARIMKRNLLMTGAAGSVRARVIAPTAS